MDPAQRTELERRFAVPGGIAWPTLGLAVGVGLAYGCSFILALRGAVPLWAAMVAHTLLGYLAFTPAHEAGHGNVAGGVRSLRWLEGLVGWSMAAVLALPYPALRYLHLQHHSFTNDPLRDPDMRASGTGPLGVLWGCLSVEIGYARVLWRLLQRGQQGARQMLRACWPFVGIWFVVFGLAGYFGMLGRILLLWIAPAALALGWLALGFDWVPHHPHDSRERYRSTRILLGTGLNTLLLGQNYHLLHHLYPRLPFYRYAECFRAVRPVLEQEGARIERVRVLGS